MHVHNYIADLLSIQDNVAVTGFGGFVARRIPARFSEDSVKMLPPYKQVMFHQQINLSDGLLERYIAHKQNINYNEAQILVAATVDIWNANLNRGERVELDKLGYLYRDAENKIRFEQDRTFNLLLDSYGLSEITFEPKPSSIKIDQETKTNTGHCEIEFDVQFNSSIVSVETSENQNTDSKLVATQDAISINKKSRPLWLKVAAAAVILPFTFYSFWVPINTDVLETKKLAFTDFNPFHQSAASIYTNQKLNITESTTIEEVDLDEIVKALPQDATSYNFNYDDELIFPVRVVKNANHNTTTVINEPKENLETLVTKNVVTDNKKVHLISGCFGVEENAHKHIKTLKEKGLDAYIVDYKGGLHRVSAMGITNDNDLSNASQKLKSLDVDFWVLKK